MFSIFRTGAAAFALGLAAIGVIAAPGGARAQDFYIGQIIMGGWNFCPRGTAPARGQLLPISQNTALFSLFGTIYGGDGRTTFALPDLRGRSPVLYGQGPGLSDIPIGHSGGAETTTLTADQMPPHSHAATSTAHTDVTISGTSAPADSDAPAGALPAVIPDETLSNSNNPNANARTVDVKAYSGAPADSPMAADMASAATLVDTSVAPAGGGASFDIRSPYQAINYCVVLFGLFPSRD